MATKIKSKGDTVEIVILVEGQSINSTYNVFSVIVHKEINRIPFARISLSDGEVGNQRFEASNSTVFVPGSKLEILVGDIQNQQLIFRGIITKHGIRMRRGIGSLEVEARDEAVKMTLGRKSSFFQNSSDSDAFKKITKNVGLKVDIESTTTIHEMLVQNNVTDWDFIVNRAEINSCNVTVEDGHLAIKKITFEEPNIAIENGQGVIDFEAEIDARYQPETVTSNSWSPKSQKIIQSKGNEPSVPKGGNIDSADLSSTLDYEELSLHGNGIIEEKEIKSWADARLLKNRLAKIRGRVKSEGRSDIKQGATVKLIGWGDRFNGNAFVSGVRHEIIEKNWNVNVQLGVEPDFFGENQSTGIQGASGLIPPAFGLHIGIVVQIEDDPGNEERIKVKIPGISEKQEGIWSRLSTFDAGANRGSYFRPEINDEVVIGYVNNDPRSPVILGSLHSSSLPAPSKASDENNEKGIETREKLRLCFDDSKKSIVSQTPNGNQIELSETLAGITIKDENKNEFIMSSEGIEIKSASDLKMEAAGKVEISCSELEFGVQNLKGDCSANLELVSGATAILKGAMVQIN